MSANAGKLLPIHHFGLGSPPLHGTAGFPLYSDFLVIEGATTKFSVPPDEYGTDSSGNLLAKWEYSTDPQSGSRSYWSTFEDLMLYQLNRRDAYPCNQAYGYSGGDLYSYVRLYQDSSGNSYSEGDLQLDVRAVRLRIVLPPGFPEAGYPVTLKMRGRVETRIYNLSLSPTVSYRDQGTTIAHMVRSSFDFSDGQDLNAAAYPFPKGGELPVHIDAVDVSEFPNPPVTSVYISTEISLVQTFLLTPNNTVMTAYLYFYRFLDPVEWYSRPPGISSGMVMMDINHFPIINSNVTGEKSLSIHLD